MTKNVFLFLCIISCTQLLSQIDNFSFEKYDALISYPSSWAVKEVNNYAYSIDSAIYYEGTKALKLYTTFASDTNKYISFSQTISWNTKSAQKISITAYIKTDSLDGFAGLWCTRKDKKGNAIGYDNSLMQNIRVTGSTEWKMYSLIILADSNVHSLTFGGYLKNNGKAWFDNIHMNTYENRGQPPLLARRYYKRLKKIIQKNSLYADSLNWSKIDSEVVILSQGISKVSELHIIVNHVLLKLHENGDIHSMLVNPHDFNKIKNSNADNRQIYSKLLDSNTAYLFIPGIITLNRTIGREFATRIQNEIKSLDSTYNIQAWIVDLRENTGGNMYPMIAGLGPLLGEGSLGYFISPSLKKENRWFYNNGKCGEKNTVNVSVKNPYIIENKNAKCLILIGENTASSGEMTAISFIGRANTTLVGTASAGYITANEQFNLPDGYFLFLASSFAADRNKRIYTKGINPDIVKEKINEEILLQLSH